MSANLRSGDNDGALDYATLEDQRDAADAMLARIASINEESVPMAMVKRMSEGENPVLVWREYRGMSGAELADAAQISEPDLVAIETGANEPGLRVMARIAAALDVDLDELVPWSQD